jgi:glycosyltransferase involved in cell wall biosynthesis
MKVLWFSNRILNDLSSIKSGSWLFAMREIIEKDVHIVNITDDISVKKVQYSRVGSVEEYVLPRYPLHNGLPASSHVSEILDIVKKVSPDIIHIWGTEQYWGLLLSRGYLSNWKVIVEIQGLMDSCANVFYGGLNVDELKRCKALKEILRPSECLDRKHRAFLHTAQYEREIISTSQFISTQSNWVRNQIGMFTKNDATIYKTLLPIRRGFVESKKWDSTTGVNKRLLIFTSTAYSTPFKGLHILIKALSTLKNKYPDCLLRIAGINLYDKPFWRLSGYERMLLHLIDKYDVRKNIEFLGKINEQQIIDQLYQTCVYVNPSLVESYSAAAAEALLLGVPSVLAYSGAMPDFSEELAVCLYYSPMDYIACAMQIDTLYREGEIRSQLTCNAIKIMTKKCDFENIRQTQLSIYDNIIKSHHH